MSQAAENQSAIIENENNSNIAMESQTTLTGSSDAETAAIDGQLGVAVQGFSEENESAVEVRDTGDDGIALISSDNEETATESAHHAGQEAEMVVQSEVFSADSQVDCEGISESDLPSMTGHGSEHQDAVEAMDTCESEYQGMDSAKEALTGPPETELTHEQTQVSSAECDSFQGNSTVVTDAAAQVVDEDGFENNMGPSQEGGNDLNKPDQQEGNAQHSIGTDIQNNIQNQDVPLSEDEDKLLAEDDFQTQGPIEEESRNEDRLLAEDDFQPNQTEEEEKNEDRLVAGEDYQSEGPKEDDSNFSRMLEDRQKVVDDEMEVSENQPGMADRLWSDDNMCEQLAVAEDADNQKVIKDQPGGIDDVPEVLGNEFRFAGESVFEKGIHLEDSTQDNGKDAKHTSSNLMDVQEGIGDQSGYIGTRLAEGSSQCQGSDSCKKGPEVTEDQHIEADHVQEDAEDHPREDGCPTSTGDQHTAGRAGTNEAEVVANFSNASETGPEMFERVVDVEQKNKVQNDHTVSADTEKGIEKTLYKASSLSKMEDADSTDATFSKMQGKRLDSVSVGQTPEGSSSIQENSSKTDCNQSEKNTDVTIVEEIGDEVLEVTGVKSEAKGTDSCDVDLTGDETDEVYGGAHEAVSAGTTAKNDKTAVSFSQKEASYPAEGIVNRIKSEGTVDVQAVRASVVDDDDDVVVLDDDEEDIQPKVKKEALDQELFNSNNDMGIQIESVSGGADELHKLADQNLVKQENGVEQKPAIPPAPVKEELQTGTASPKKTPTRNQTCIVCKRVGKCKYNIVRNGDIKHLCDDACFRRFRANPTMFLKGTAVSDKSKAPQRALRQATAKTSVPGIKSCAVCLVMNVNAQGQFCMWKGLDFCGEGCLGKFQNGISPYCSMCKTFIPPTARSINCLRVGNEVRPFCSSRCCADYNRVIQLCATCHTDISKSSISFSSPVGSDKTFKDFCSQGCFKKYEDLLSTDVEIIRVEPGKTKKMGKCNVCQKNQVAKHSIKFNGTIHHLCSDPCLSAFRYANKLDVMMCDFCNSTCTSLGSSSHTVQFEGSQKRFCSDKCVSQYRLTHRKTMPCSWCGSVHENFDMIERLDSNNKCQLFCSLNCLSLYRVNLQAKSNQAVKCDQCAKCTPAQYHLTMSDASVRNFCSYNCVMTFQAQFSKGTPPSAQQQPIPIPKHKHNTRGKASNRSIQQAAAAPAPSVPVISNVISLAPQGLISGTPKTNSKSNQSAPSVASGTSPAVKTASTGSGPVQQKVIVQPPLPKIVKNKSLLCKPFIQTKATSCRPHTLNKECQTDRAREKPALVPVPVPVYLPTPMALYAAPTPTPVFIPVPIPVPIFIPTTRKSAQSIMKHIKEIQDKTPSDPLEAELLMMAAAVSGDKQESSDSDTEDEALPDVERQKKRSAPDDDNGADVMPLSSSKVEEGVEEDMISMALRMAEEMSGPITDLEAAVEAVPVNTDPPPPSSVPTETVADVDEYSRTRRGAKRASSTRRPAGRPPKRTRIQGPTQSDQQMNMIQQQPAAPPGPPADANYHLKFTYGINAWRHWVMFKNAQMERNSKAGSSRAKLFKTDLLQYTADELNFSLCLFVKEVRKPSGDEYSPDSIYYLTLGLQQYLFENGRIDNIFSDVYYERFTDSLTQILSQCQPKFNSAGQMVCRIEEEHLWESKQLGAHSPYVLLNTLIYFHTKYFMLKTPEDHMKLSFAHILKYWKKGQAGKVGQPARSVSLRYYSVSSVKKDGSTPTSTTKKGSKDGIPVYEVTENQENPLRCPVKLYEFYLSKCPESIKNRSDIFYPVPERSCVPDSPVWYSTIPIGVELMTKMLTRILLVREIQEAHLHAQPIFV